MNRAQFMEQLKKLLSDISEEERQEALDYYESYFDDAGENQEAEVIRELGSPGKVAATEPCREGLSCRTQGRQGRRDTCTDPSGIYFTIDQGHSRRNHRIYCGTDLTSVYPCIGHRGSCPRTFCNRSDCNRRRYWSMCDSNTGIWCSWNRYWPDSAFSCIFCMGGEPCTSGNSSQVHGFLRQYIKQGQKGR